ncbi:LysR family transcriptional regulator [Kitasatospora sp. NPDC057015]|uniref:LysR family transcriptional regulator n=1 Tax=Kitasatospora sp. NPDC057015 TaxID=3346001 RepID=UPI00363A0610
MLDVRRLVLLRDLADHGTVTAVAELHRVTPSAVSQQLRLLEEETGSHLLERTGRAVHLTAAGRRLARDTEDVLTALERARARLHTGAEQPAGEFHLACFPSALSPLAAPLGRALELAHPELRPHITEAEPDAAVRLLLGRGVDLALTYRYTNLAAPAYTGVETHPVCTDPLVAVLRTDHPAAGAPGRPIDLGELRESEWIAAPAQSACGQALLHACRARGFTPRVRHTCSDFSAMLSLAAAAGQVALVPALAATRLPDSLTSRAVADQGLAREVEAAIRPGTSREPAVAASLRALRRLMGAEEADSAPGTGARP